MRREIAALEETMSTDVQLPLFSRLLAALARAPERPDGGLALQPDRFPVEARECHC
jgi:hypothetical protein